ncbi:MAG: glycosyltransferase family 2 protein [Nanoarchaeota archaeon]|nr:MAG: glycosyltransferase family 2 protein [Nanoarchaeota archaeon]
MLVEISAAITFIFLLVVISYYVLLFIPAKKIPFERKIRSILVVIPARNEAARIGNTLEAVIAARFNGRKRILVIDDGSTDGTSKIVSSKNGVELVRSTHKGKAAALNNALAKCKEDAFVVVDADSIINPDSLLHMAEILGRRKVGAVTSVVKVRNRKTFIGMWLHLEQLYNSLMRYLLVKANANIVTPGPLGMYRADALKKINGFSEEGFSEDIDVTVRLVRAGYHVGFSEKSVSETIMPVTAKGFFKQRSRFARGMLNVFKRHLKPSWNFIDFYTLPLFLFGYIQAVILGTITVYLIASGYFIYFASKGIYFSLSVLIFLLDWLSLVGFTKWFLGIFTGITPLNFAVAVGVLSTLLSYPLFLIAILKFDKKIDIWHVIPFIFMFPYWLCIMVVYIWHIPELFRKRQRNIWEKVS